MIFAIANQKGGVGKTTLSINLSSALALMGYRVLLIDMDPQGNSTEGLGINASRCEYTIYDSLVDQVPIAQATIPHRQKNLFVVPSMISLFGAEAVLTTRIGRHFCLKNAVKPETKRYDYIMIDCPPNLGVLTINAMVASTDIIIPLEPNAYALKGVGGLFNAILKIQDELRCYPNLAGVVINMFNPINSLHRSIAERVSENFPPGKVLNTRVHRNSVISEAEIYGQSTIQYKPQDIASEIFLKLANEIVHQNNAERQNTEAEAIR